MRPPTCRHMAALRLPSEGETEPPKLPSDVRVLEPSQSAHLRKGDRYPKFRRGDAAPPERRWQGLPVLDADLGDPTRNVLGNLRRLRDRPALCDQARDLLACGDEAAFREPANLESNHDFL